MISTSKNQNKRSFPAHGSSPGLNPKVKNLLPCNLLERFLNEPIVFSRDEKDQLHCFSNVCTHRGKVVLDKPCKQAGLRCGYHGRCFSLEGEILSMPEFQGVKDFPSEKDNLAKIPFETWQEFMFASLDPVAPLEDFTIEMQSVAAEFDFEDLKLLSRKSYFVRAHWALYCENYLEGFHIPFVHKALNEALDYGSYTTELFRYSILQTGYDARGRNRGKIFFRFSEFNV